MRVIIVGDLKITHAGSGDKFETILDEVFSGTQKLVGADIQEESVTVLFQSTIKSLNDPSVTYAGSINTSKASTPSPSTLASSRDGLFASAENKNTQLPTLDLSTKEKIVSHEKLPQLGPLDLSTLKKKWLRIL